MNQAVILIGSNIDPDKNIHEATTIVKKEQKLLGESSFVKTEPIGFTGQPDFMNGAILIETGLELNALVDWLKSVERKLGRIKTANKFAPRTIDLDVVVWNGNVIDEDFYEREYVRSAVLELLPDLRF